MGLLSSRGFRNILLGAGSRYQELSRNALEIATEGQKNLREIGGSMANLEGIFLNQRNRILGIV